MQQRVRGRVEGANQHPPAVTVGSRLASVDWNFTDRSARERVHDLHPYPARFIPEVPRHLIRLLHPGGDLAVLDPFCGSGTTLVEGASADLPVIGVDLHPLAVLISRVKLTPPTMALEPLARNVVEEARSEPAPVPDIPRLDHWFELGVQDVLARLMLQIDRVPEQQPRDALRVALSRIVVRVSNQESDTRYAAVQKHIDGEQVYASFLDSAVAVDGALERRFGGMFPKAPRFRLLQRDILTVRPEELGPVGLVVTSPPYPNAYEYWLYHKYRMYWLGMDPIAVREAEIGARPHYFKKKHQTEHDFERQMSYCFSVLREVLIPGGFACFLVGSSVIHGREIDNVDLLRRASTPHGFRVAGQELRSIPRGRKTFNPTNGRIEQETIVVFERAADT